MQSGFPRLPVPPRRRAKFFCRGETLQACDELCRMSTFHAAVDFLDLLQVARSGNGECVRAPRT